MLPTTLPAAPAVIRLHEHRPGGAARADPPQAHSAGEAQDLAEILPLSDKKIATCVDFSTAAFTIAEPGRLPYGLASLELRTYFYTCFVNEGGKKKGTLHWDHGMYGTFEVQ